MGQWILFDAALRIQQIGPAPYQGKSATSTLDMVANRTVLPALLKARERGEGEAAREVTKFGEQLVVQIVPILGPWTKAPIAWLGRYGEERASPPVVGAFEWLVPPAAAERRARMYLSPAMHLLYGTEPAPEQTDPDDPALSWWHGAQYFDEHVGYAYRMVLRRAFELALRAPHNTPHYERFHKGNRRTGKVETLHQVLWREATAATAFGVSPDVQLLRGTTTGVDERPGENDLVEGLQDLAGAHTSVAPPHAMIDTSTGAMWSRSNRFDLLGLYLPIDRLLREMCHPDDFERLMAMLVRTAAQHNTPELLLVRAEPSPLIRARFATGGRSQRDGSYRELTLQAIAVRTTSYPSNVLVYFYPPEVVPLLGLGDG